MRRLFPQRLAHVDLLGRNDLIARLRDELDAQGQSQRCRLRSEVLLKRQDFRSKGVRVMTHERRRYHCTEVTGLLKRLHQQRMEHLRRPFGPFGPAEIRDLIGPGRIGHLRGVVDRARFRRKYQQGCGMRLFFRKVDRDFGQHLLARFDRRGRQQGAARNGRNAERQQKRAAPAALHRPSPGPGGGGAAPRTMTEGSLLTLVAKPVSEVERLSRLVSALYASGRSCVWRALTVSLLDSSSG